MIKHHIEQLRTHRRRPLSHRAASAGRPASAAIGQLSAGELRKEVLALLG